jgi:hypothetical protein
VTIGLVDVQLVGREAIGIGLTCVKRALNLGPTRSEGARMKDMQAKRKRANRTGRNRNGVARLEEYQATPPEVLTSECVRQ